MIAERESTKLLLEHGITSYTDGNTQMLEVPSGIALFEVYKKALGIDAYRNNRVIMREAHQSRGTTLSHNVDEFTGGTAQMVYDAAEGKFDTRMFLQQRERIAKSLKVQAADLMLARRRVRSRSEYDGELDLDRLYEIQPFNSAQFQNTGVVRTIKLNVGFAFSCAVSADKIAKYGALAWAIADMIERRGIQVEIVLWVRSSGSDQYFHHPTAKHTDNRYINITVKRAGEYSQILSLARCFTPWFYRRVIFTAKCLATDSHGVEIQTGLSHPKQINAEAKQGEITIGQHFVDYQPDFQQIERWIKTAVTGER